MKKSTLMKKVFAALLVLVLAGLFTACSNNTDDKKSEEKTYTIKYDGAAIFSDLSQAEFDEGKDGMTEGTDYTLNGTSVELTDSGFSKLLASFVEMLKADEETQGLWPSGGQPVAVAIYSPEELMFPLTDTMLSNAASGLTEHDDYEASEHGSVIVLTESGYEKAVGILFQAG